MKEWLSGKAKENRNKHRGWVNHGGAGGYRDWFVVSGSRVSVEWGAEYMEYDTMTTALEIMDYYIDHCIKEQKEFATYILKQAKRDIENAVAFKE